MNFNPEDILSQKQIDFTEKLHENISLIIHVNNYCNLKCEYCKYSKIKEKEKRKEINIKILNRILNDFKYLSEIHKLPLNVSLLGGEIYVYDKIDELMDTIYKSKINNILILSNLTLPEKIIKYHKNNFNYIFTFHSTQMKDNIFIKHLEKLMSQISSKNIKVKLFFNNEKIEEFCKENNIKIMWGDLDFENYKNIFESKNKVIRKCYSINFNYIYNELFIRHVCKNKIIKLSEIRKIDIKKFIIVCDEICPCDELEYCIKKEYKVIK